MIIVYILIVLFSLRIYASITAGHCHSSKRLDGKVVLITGSSRGIGYEAALNLAKRGAKIIITSEDIDELKIAQKKLKQVSKNSNIIAKHLDLLSFSGIRAFAKDILDTETRLDILVNNAGSFGQRKQFTEDRLSPVMQINYFGRFLLTFLLIDLLKKSAPTRIVNVSSAMGNLSFCFDPNDIQKIKYFSNTFFKDVMEYCNSKICMTSSTIQMAKMLEGTGGTVNCLHPGGVNTKLIELIIYSHKPWLGYILDFLRFFVLKSPKEGAQMTIHLAVCEKVEGITGKYFSDCRKSWIFKDLGSKVRNKIWEQSIKLTGLTQKEVNML